MNVLVHCGIGLLLAFIDIMILIFYVCRCLFVYLFVCLFTYLLEAVQLQYYGNGLSNPKCMTCFYFLTFLGHCDISFFTKRLLYEHCFEAEIVIRNLRFFFNLMGMLIIMARNSLLTESQ